MCFPPLPVSITPRSDLIAAALSTLHYLPDLFSRAAESFLDSQGQLGLLKSTVEALRIGCGQEACVFSPTQLVFIELLLFTSSELFLGGTRQF